jgi:ABC-type phosphate transport system substrate-binding protein
MAFLLGLRGASGADFKLIVNPASGVDSLSATDVKGIFLETKKSLQPVLLKGGVAHEDFVKNVLGRSDSALNNYYRSLVFSGTGSIPKAFASDEEVVAYIAKTKGAIGYVSSAAALDGVKVLDVK